VDICHFAQPSCHKIFNGHMLICRNAEGANGKRKTGNPWPNPSWRFQVHRLVPDLFGAGRDPRRPAGGVSREGSGRHEHGGAASDVRRPPSV